MKLEKEKQAAAKVAGKRLNKRPPAAMETQRMPAALRATTAPGNIPTTTSQRNSKASSRRSSMSSQEPESDTDRPRSSRLSFRGLVGFDAPQFPKIFQRRSRSGSMSSQTTFADGEEQYLRDLVSFADQLDTSAVDASDPPGGQRVRKVSFSCQTDDETERPTPQRSTTMPISLENTEMAPLTPKFDKPWMKTRSRSGSNSSTSSSVVRGAQDKEKGSHRFSKSAKVLLGGETQPQEDGVEMTSSSKQEQSDLPGPSSPKPLKGDPKRVRAPPPAQASASDSYIQTHSYVQTHRMHEQQRSIASYEDQLALRGANEFTAAQRAMELERQRMPPTPNDSFESLTDEEIPQYNKQESFEASHNEQNAAKENVSSLGGKESASVVMDDQQQASSTQSERTPGLQRRPKVVSPSVSTTSTRTVTQTTYGAALPFRPVSPPSPVSQETITLVSKKSKSENLLEAAVAKPPIPPPKAANRTSPRSNPRLGIETGSYASRHREARSTTGNSSTKSSQDLTLGPSSPKGLTTLANVSTISDPSPRMEGRTHLPSEPIAGARDTRNTSKGSTWTNTNPSRDSLVPPEVRISKPVPEVVVEGIDGDGMVRRASVKRPRSTPQLQDIVVSKDLSFLPELKHQALVKPDRKSPTSSLDSSRSSVGGLSSLEKRTAYSPPQFPAPSPPSTRPSSEDGSSLQLGASSLNYNAKVGSRSSVGTMPSSLLRPGSGVRRSTMSNGSSANSAAAAQQLKPVAKLFVICCNCNYWHDLPSQMYKEMAMPRQIVGEDQVAESVDASRGNEPKSGNNNADGVGRGDERRNSRLEGRVETSVQCPWCEHGMNTACCAGWSCIVYLHERHH